MLPLRDPSVERRVPPMKKVLPKLVAPIGQPSCMTAAELRMMHQLCDKLSDDGKYHSVAIEKAEVDLLCGKLLGSTHDSKVLVLDLVRTLTLVSSARGALSSKWVPIVCVSLGPLGDTYSPTGLRRVCSEALAAMFAASPRRAFRDISAPSASHEQYKLVADQSGSGGSVYTAGAELAAGDESTGVMSMQSVARAVDGGNEWKCFALQATKAATRILLAPRTGSPSAADKKLMLAAGRLLMTVSWCLGQEAGKEESKGSGKSLAVGNGIVEAACGVIEGFIEAGDEEEKEAGFRDGLNRTVLLAAGTACHWVPEARKRMEEFEVAMAWLESVIDGIDDAEGDISGRWGKQDATSVGAIASGVLRVLRAEEEEPAASSGAGADDRGYAPAAGRGKYSNGGYYPIDAPTLAVTHRQEARELELERARAEEGVVVASASRASAAIPNASNATYPKDPQRDFDEARQMVALSLLEARERKEAIEEVGLEFQRDAEEAARHVPELMGLGKWSKGQQDEAVQAATGHAGYDARGRVALHGLERVSGGIAGGAKAIHKQHGLFLKTPSDEHGLYGSDVMAAKVMKLEMKAARWVHEMDSIHANGALTTVVDVPYEHKDGGGMGVYRVLVQARLGVGSTTLRYGSSNSGRTIHQDEEQERDVVDELADHFWLAPIGQALCEKLVLHRYKNPADDTECAFNWLDYMKSKGHDMREIEEAFIPTDISDRSVESMVLEAGADLGASYQPRNDPHAYSEIALASPGPPVTVRLQDGSLSHKLPFDVEVHQLSSGRRMVLDSHRLLMPDLAWIKWLRKSDESRPSVWAVQIKTSGEPMPIADEDRRLNLRTGQLDDIRTWDKVSAGRLPNSVRAWAQGMGLLDLSDDVQEVSKHRGAGIVLLSSKPSKEKPSVLFVVSCPAWYWGNTPSLTCMMPPEAARVVRELKDGDGNALPRVSPDCMLRQGCDPAGNHKTALLQVTGALYSEGRLKQVHRELLHSCEQVPPEDDGVTRSRSDRLASLRAAAKAVLKKYGLCLRHIGMVHRLSERGLQQLTADMLWACCLPLPGTQSGRALADALAAAKSAVSCEAGKSLDITAVTWAVCSARSFAARGLLLPGTSMDDFGGSEMSQSKMGRFNFDAEVPLGAIALAQHDDGHNLAAHEGPCLPNHIAVGISQAAAGGSITRRNDGSIDLEGGKYRVLKLLTELGHVQRVHGSGQARLLKQLASVGKHGGHLRSMAFRCIARVGSCTMSGRDEAESSSNAWMSRSLQGLGSIEAALGCHIYRRKDHSYSIGVVDTSNMASCLHSMGRHGEALKLHEECKEVMARVLGKEHPHYLNTVGNMANCLHSMGRYGEALNLYRESKEIMVRVLGSEHPHYLQTAGNMASCLDSIGRYGEALKLHEECREVRARVLGREHPDYLHTVGNMASCLHSMGRQGEALKLHEECKEVKTRVLGREHPQYLHTVGNMASCLHSMGRHGEALKLHEECKEVTARVLGKEHPDYLSTVGNMANCLHSMGRHAEALKLHEECKEVKSCVLGREHPSYLRTVGNTAVCLYDMGRHGEALKLHEECKEVKIRVLGREHPDYLHTVGNMASCLYSMGRYGEALKLYEECKEKQARVLGREHPDYLRTVSNMTICLESMGRYGEALKLH